MCHSFECRHVFLFFFISMFLILLMLLLIWLTYSFLFFMVPPSAFFCKAVCTRVLCVSSNICASDLLTKDGLFLWSIWLFGCVQNSWVNSSLAWPSGGPSDGGYETPREGLSPVGPVYEKETAKREKTRVEVKMKESINCFLFSDRDWGSAARSL